MSKGTKKIPPQVIRGQLSFSDVSKDWRMRVTTSIACRKCLNWFGLRKDQIPDCPMAEECLPLKKTRKGTLLCKREGNLLF